MGSTLTLLCVVPASSRAVGVPTGQPFMGCQKKNSESTTHSAQFLNAKSCPRALPALSPSSPAATSPTPPGCISRLTPASLPHFCDEVFRTRMMTSTTSAHAAIDLGASSGRVMLGTLVADRWVLAEVHRFENQPVVKEKTLQWEVERLFEESLVGLAKAVERSTDLGTSLASIGVDSWGVDFALLDRLGSVVGPVPHYRGAPDPTLITADRTLTAAEVYVLSGVPDHAINTSLRLAARAKLKAFDGERLLFIPDLWVYLLTGIVGTEQTIASTSQLLSAATGAWSEDLIEASCLPGLTLPAVSAPGCFVGLTTPTITSRIGSVSAVPVYRVAEHDTASAFAFAVPSETETIGLISSGTWSLVGLSLHEPVLSRDALCHGFTNERGIDSTLFLRNLNGMWLLQQCIQEWRSTGVPVPELSELLDSAAATPGDGRVFDVSDARLLAPGPMVVRIAKLSQEVGPPQPPTHGDVVRAILDSLAAAYGNALAEAAHLAGVTVTSVRIVGGGSLNPVLCQLTADATGLPVVTGPAEASSIGNIAAQIVASGVRTTITEVYNELADEGTASVTYFPRMRTMSQRRQLENPIAPIPIASHGDSMRSYGSRERWGIQRMISSFSPRATPRWKRARGECSLKPPVPTSERSQRRILSRLTLMSCLS